MSALLSFHDASGQEPRRGPWGSVLESGALHHGNRIDRHDTPSALLLLLVARQSDANDCYADQFVDRHLMIIWLSLCCAPGQTDDLVLVSDAVTTEIYVLQRLASQ
jgi:hypothetical protein